MTVHCVKVMTSSDVDQQNVKDKISDLKSKYGEKLPKQDAPFDLSEPYDLSFDYYLGVFRVTLTDGDKTTKKDDLTEQIRKEADKSASWWQVRWHECDHDETDRTGCSWEYQNDSGNVPSEVQW